MRRAVTIANNSGRLLASYGLRPLPDDITGPIRSIMDPLSRVVPSANVGDQVRAVFTGGEIWQRDQIGPRQHIPGIATYSQELPLFDSRDNRARNPADASGNVVISAADLEKMIPTFPQTLILDSSSFVTTIVWGRQVWQRHLWGRQYWIRAGPPSARLIIMVDSCPVWTRRVVIVKSLTILRLRWKDRARLLFSAVSAVQRRWCRLLRSLLFIWRGSHYTLRLDHPTFRERLGWRRLCGSLGYKTIDQSNESHPWPSSATARACSISQVS